MPGSLLVEEFITKFRDEESGTLQKKTAKNRNQSVFEILVGMKTRNLLCFLQIVPAKASTFCAEFLKKKVN